MLYCSDVFKDDNSEIRALVVDNMEGMFPRIYTTLGKAAFWMDQRLHEKQLPPEVIGCSFYEFVDGPHTYLLSLAETRRLEDRVVAPLFRYN